MSDTAVPARDSVQFAATAALLALALLLGGGQGGLGDTLVQLGALALIGLMLASELIRARLFAARLPLAVLFGAIAIPLLQMVPGLGFSLLGPERALWGLLPAAALFLSACTLNAARQRQLLGVFLAMAVLGLVLGLMQLADGPDSPLRFYANTNPSEAVGWFANRNHMAAMLVMALPLSVAAAAQAVSERAQGRPIGVLAVVATIGLAVLVILGIALTRSRAGVLLGMLGLLLSVPMVLALRKRRGFKRMFAIIVSIALLLTVQFALYGLLQRFQKDPMADLRWHIGEQTIEAAKANLPMGAGLGSFRQVFQAQDVQAPTAAIINHAHNDYLELWLEAGWPFVLVAGLFGALLLREGLRAWRHADGHTNELWPQAAAISLILVLLHSAADYPLRTTSLQAVFAVLLAVLISSRPRPSKTRQGSPR